MLKTVSVEQAIQLGSFSRFCVDLSESYEASSGIS